MTFNAIILNTIYLKNFNTLNANAISRSISAPNSSKLGQKISIINFNRKDYN